MISNKKQWTRKNSNSTNGDCDTMERINTTNVGAQHRCTINDDDRKRDYQMLKWKKKTVKHIPKKNQQKKKLIIVNRPS